jgi:ElaB/YqjD/DUF883 family membrane-anchored ribosome-binding protein
METGSHPDENDKPSPNTEKMGEAGALGKSVKTNVEQAGTYVKEKMMTVYSDGGIEQVSQDIAEYTREQPLTALLIASGVGLVVGVLLTLGRR